MTVLASQPSVSMETETTHRIASPSRPCLPTVFITSRSNSWSVMFSACWRSPVRSMISRRKRSISSAAMVRKLSSSASPDSISSLSINRVFGRASGLPCSSKFRNRARRPFSRVVDPSSFGPMEARDVVVNQFGRGRVVADDDEAGRHADSVFYPLRVRLFIVPVERFQSSDQQHRQLERI